MRIRIKQEIMKKGLKQQWIADQIGVDPAMITRWMWGRATPSEDQAGRLSEILGLTVEEILTED